GVDRDGRGKADRGIGPGVELRDQALQHRGRTDVVMGRPAEVLTSRPPEGEGAIAHAADVVGVAPVANPRIARRVPTADLLGPVGRRVVGDQQLEVVVRLSKYRFDRLLEELVAVVDRQTDAHPGHSGWARHRAHPPEPEGAATGAGERVTIAK